MMEPASQNTDYDVGSRLSQREWVTSFAGTERSAGSAVVLHKVEPRFGLNESARQRCNVTLRRFARLLHPRTPRVVDSWYEDECLWVVEYTVPGISFNLDTANPFMDSGRTKPGDLFEGSLTLLSALHLCEVSHRELRPECFGLGRLGRVVLLDSGLVGALIGASSDQDDTDMMLSQNIFARDVADWASWMISLQLGESLMRGALEERWDELHFKEAESKLRRIVRSPEAQRFFMMCLSGYGATMGQFESATEALKYWNRNKIWGLLV